MEMSQLPKYCYAQYLDDKLASNPTYSIQGCGPFMNHFCPGLLGLIRAQQPSHKPFQRRADLSRAMDNIEYTLKGMPAVCWLRADAEAARNRARVIEQTIPKR